MAERDYSMTRRTFLAISAGAMGAYLAGCGSQQIAREMNNKPNATDNVDANAEIVDNSSLMANANVEIISAQRSDLRMSQNGVVILDVVPGDLEATTIAIDTPFDRPQRWDGRRFRLGLADDYIRQRFGDELLQRLYALTLQV